MTRARYLWLLATIPALIVLLSPGHAWALEGSSVARVSLAIVFGQPLVNGSWPVTVEYDGGACSGVVGPNVYYLQTRSVSSTLLVLPLYYVLSNVCPEVLEWLNGLGDGVVSVSVEAPDGFIVRTGMDWRGFGGTGGPYTMGLGLFLRHYLFDGVVVADARLYSVVDTGGASVVFWHTVREDALAALDVLVIVRGAATDWLGASPRSPVVLVLAPSDEHVFLPPGTAHSIGGVVYVKLGSGRDWLLHTVAHEALHGWFNHGLVFGGFGFQEAVVEFLSMRALWERAPEVYELVEPYLRGLMDADEQYGVWMRVHAALWLASREYCGGDLYTLVLRRLFEEAVEKEPVGPLSLPRLAALMVDSAPSECRDRLRGAIGTVMVSAAQPTDTWPFVDTGFLTTSGRERTVTVTVVSTTTTVVVETTSVTVTARGEEGASWPLLVLVVLALVGLGVGMLRCRGKFSG